MAASGKKSVLFVCLGNICRSPMAEAIFADMVNRKGLTDQWHVDSAAIMGWHIGSSPDERGLQCLGSHGIQTSHRGRKVSKSDFKKFDTIFGMDEENMRDLEGLAPSDGKAEIKLLGSYDPQKQTIIEDPYYGGDAGFETVFQQCTRCCEAFLAEKS